MTEREDILATLSNGRDHRFAEMLVLAVGIAAETAPERLKAALSHVFDLSEYERQAEKIGAIYRNLAADDAGRRDKLDRLERENASLRERIERLEDRCGRMAKFLNAKYGAAKGAK